MWPSAQPARRRSQLVADAFVRRLVGGDGYGCASRTIEVALFHFHFEKGLHTLEVSLIAFAVGDRQRLQHLAHVAEPILARRLGQVRLVDEGAHMGVCDLIAAEALLIGEYAPGAKGAVIDPARCWRQAVGDHRRRAMKERKLAA